MIFDFDELHRRCRRYWLKRLIKTYGAWIAAFAVVVGAGWYFGIDSPPFGFNFFGASGQTSFSSSAFSTSRIASSSHSTHSTKDTKVAKRCYALQLFYAYDRYMGKLLEYNKKVKRIGFSCYVKRGVKLENGHTQLFLICNTQRSKRALRPWIDLAKKEGIDYVVVRERCSHIFKNIVPYKHKQAYKKLPSSSPKEVISAKEFSLIELQRLFSQRQSYDLAIQIARSYVDKKRYQEALYWAKKANALNREKEEAWILYAKSLKEMGQAQRARQILRVYLDYKESDKAQKLLKEWQ